MHNSQAEVPQWYQYVTDVWVIGISGRCRFQMFWAQCVCRLFHVNDTVFHWRLANWVPLLAAACHDNGCFCANLMPAAHCCCFVQSVCCEDSWNFAPACSDFATVQLGTWSWNLVAIQANVSLQRLMTHEGPVQHASVRSWRLPTAFWGEPPWILSRNQEQERPRRHVLSRGRSLHGLPNYVMAVMAISVHVFPCRKKT